MHQLFRLTLVVLLMCVALVSAPAASAACPGNRLVNPSFEEGIYQSSLSSWMSNGWTPWSLNEGAQWNREPEYKLMDLASMIAGGAGAEGDYRVLEGNRSQAFFTGYSTHTSGFYQIVAVPRGSKVTFTIWVQIDTGEKTSSVNGHSLADLESPGNYRTYAGIDPFAHTPAGYGSIAPDTVIWSPALLDRETRRTDQNGSPYDAWVQLSVSTIAQGDHIAVYTKGQPEFPTNKNISFWDDACLVVETPPTATPRPTDPPTATPLASNTPEPTDTPVPSETPLPTATPEPTATALPPTATAIPPTATPAPSETPMPPTATVEPTLVPPTATPQPTLPVVPSSGGGDGFLFLYAGIAVVAVFAILWLRIARKR